MAKLMKSIGMDFHGKQKWRRKKLSGNLAETWFQFEFDEKSTENFKLKCQRYERKEIFIETREKSVKTSNWVLERMDRSKVTSNDKVKILMAMIAHDVRVLTFNLPNQLSRRFGCDHLRRIENCKTHVTLLFEHLQVDSKITEKFPTVELDFIENQTKRELL